MSFITKIGRNGKLVAMKRASRRVARSAKTGRFVSMKYAKRHPSTTVVETVIYRLR